MKVLYVGHYKELTGWGKAARDYILALDAAGVEVVPRAIKLNNSQPEIPARILELEQRSTAGATHCIQHVLPHHLDFNGRFKKNIAIGVYESFGATMSSWPAQLNLMDEVWVPSKFTDDVMYTMGVTVPIQQVPHCFDMSVYERKFEPLSNPELDGNYVFYTIADMNRRKDMLTMLQAFHLEFTANEPVRLLIKTSRHGMSAREAANMVINECNTIKSSMKLMRRPEDYSQEVVITDTLTDEDIYRLHATGNCFVTTTHGEAWSIPLFEANAFGKDCIYPDGMFDYMPWAGGYSVDKNRPVFGMNDTFQDISTSRETWFTGDIQDIRWYMRRAYEGSGSSHLKSRPDLSQYTHLAVGHLMESLL